jgi:hypothetical protein
MKETQIYIKINMCIPRPRRKKGEVEIGRKKGKENKSIYQKVRNPNNLK